MTENKSIPKEIDNNSEEHRFEKLKKSTGIDKLTDKPGPTSGPSSNGEPMAKMSVVNKGYYNRNHYFAYRVRIGKDNTESFALLPLVDNTVYIRGIFSVEQRAFYLHSKEMYDNLQILPAIDEFGQQELDKRERRPKYQRIRLESNYEYQMSKPEDIEWFINSFVENAQEFLDWYRALPDLAIVNELNNQEGKIITNVSMDDIPKELLPTM